MKLPSSLNWDVKIVREMGPRSRGCERLLYLHCVRNGNTAVLHLAIGMLS